VAHRHPARRPLLGFAVCVTLLACGDGSTTPSPVVDTDVEIEIVFINHGTPSQDAAFQSAADRSMES